MDTGLNLKRTGSYAAYHNLGALEHVKTEWYETISGFITTPWGFVKVFSFKGSESRGGRRYTAYSFIQKGNYTTYCEEGVFAIERALVVRARKVVKKFVAGAL